MDIVLMRQRFASVVDIIAMFIISLNGIKVIAIADPVKMWPKFLDELEMFSKCVEHQQKMCYMCFHACLVLGLS